MSMLDLFKGKPTAGRAEKIDEQSFEREVLPYFARGELGPVIDRELPLTEAPAAHRLLESSAHFGKVVLRVDPHLR